MTEPAPVVTARHVALDLIGVAARAVAVALVSALGLGAAVLLLAQPARASETGTGALLLRSAEGAESVSAPLLSTDVAFRITGMVARAHVIQTFENASADWVEGVYVFPLPENAAVDHLRLRVGERTIEGEIREREAAQRTYVAARASGRRAALLDQERPNIFTTSVANIGPRERVTVELEYQQTLRYENGRYSMRFPMVVGPRYVPGALKVSDASRITPPVLRPDSGRENRLRLHVDLDAGVPLATVSSPYHALRTREVSESRREFDLADGDVPASRDFELDWAPQAGPSPRVAWFTERKHGRYYGLLMILPPAASPGARLAREVTFVLDTSGSMAGASIRQAKEALELALARLGPGDRFNVIEFNSSAQRLFAAPQDVNPRNVRLAIDWVRGLEARGGTEMASALRLALAGGEAEGRIRQVVFLTDGAVGNEEALFGLIRERLGEARLFTVGIGSAPNSHFMSKAAQLGRGTFTYIGRIDEVQQKMSELFAKIESPVMKGIEVRWPAGVHAEAWPARVPDLYAGEPVVVVCELDRLAGDLRISGTRDGRAWEARVPLAAHGDGAGVGSLWARGKVESLTDSLREGAPEDAVRAQVIELAMAHRLVTKYTSFVAVDTSPARASGEALKQTAVPTNLPEGWEYGKVFGELPRGATDSRFALLSGAALALLALAMLRRRVA